MPEKTEGQNLEMSCPFVLLLYPLWARIEIDNPGAILLHNLLCFLLGWHWPLPQGTIDTREMDSRWADVPSRDTTHAQGEASRCEGQHLCKSGSDLLGMRHRIHWGNKADDSMKGI